MSFWREPVRDPVLPGQESVWDYPRPPRLERGEERIVVEFGGLVIADTTRAIRMLETSHPPTYYLPPADITEGVLVPSQRGAARTVSGRETLYWHCHGGVDGSKADMRLELPRPVRRVRRAPRSCRLLLRSDGSLLRRRRDSDATARRLLRRMGNERSRRTVQGRSRHARLVSSFADHESRRTRPNQLDPGEPSSSSPWLRSFRGPDRRGRDDARSIDSIVRGGPATLVAGIGAGDPRNTDCGRARPPRSAGRRARLRALAPAARRTGGDRGEVVRATTGTEASVILAARGAVWSIRRFGEAGVRALLIACWS